MRDFELPRVVRVEVPLRLVSEANVREHWATKARRAKAQRKATWAALYGQGVRMPAPCRITITRVGKRRLDSDNLARSAKAVRDGVADWLEIDDGDERLTWRYEQTTGAVYGVMIRVEPWSRAHAAAEDIGMGG